MHELPRPVTSRSADLHVPNEGTAPIGPIRHGRAGEITRDAPSRPVPSLPSTLGTTPKTDPVPPSPYPKGDGVGEASLMTLASRHPVPEVVPLQQEVIHMHHTTEPPLLREGLDPRHTGPTYNAWRFLWAATEHGPAPWAPTRAEMVDLYGISPKTADNVIRTAVRNGHLTKRGGYSAKRQTDTRTIERKDPQR